VIEVFVWTYLERNTSVIKAFSVVHIEEDPNFGKGCMRLKVPGGDA